MKQKRTACWSLAHRVEGYRRGSATAEGNVGSATANAQRWGQEIVGWRNGFHHSTGGSRGQQECLFCVTKKNKPETIAKWLPFREMSSILLKPLGNQGPAYVCLPSLRQKQKWLELQVVRFYLVMQKCGNLCIYPPPLFLYHKENLRQASNTVS